MSLEKENVPENEEAVSFIDDVFAGGEDSSHSPEEKDETLLPDNPDTPDPGDELIPDDEDDDPFETDSPSEDSKDTTQPEAQENAEATQTVPEQDKELEQEIATLRKRLHDTQAAMHRATSERARLAKELEELKAREKDDDDWFGEDDKSRVKELEKNIQLSDDEIARHTTEAKQIAEEQWDKAAAPVIKAHPDFEEIVYNRLVPLLNPNSGNAAIYNEWLKMADKSPAATYSFAKKALEMIEFQRDPEAYKKRIREDALKTAATVKEEAPTGKEGLDFLPSADMPGSSRERTKSFVDAVFG